MYDYIKNQWIMGKFTSVNIQKCVAKGYITQDQADGIMKIPQITN